MTKCLTHQGWLLIRLGRLEEARAALERSRASLEALDPAITSSRRADPLPALGVLALVQGDYVEAARLGEIDREQSQARNDPGNLMFAWYVLSNAALGQGHTLRYTGAMSSTSASAPPTWKAETKGLRKPSSSSTATPARWRTDAACWAGWALFPGPRTYPATAWQSPRPAQSHGGPPGAVS